MQATTEQHDGQATLMAFWSAVEAQDFEAVKRLLADDFVMESPQSGERFVGRDNAVGAVLATEEKGEPTGEPRITGSGDLWTVVAPVRYGTDPYWYVGIFELDGGQIRHATEFYGAPFAAQPGRARYAEPNRG